MKILNDLAGAILLASTVIALCSTMSASARRVELTRVQQPQTPSPMTKAPPQIVVSSPDTL